MPEAPTPTRLQPPADPRVEYSVPVGDTVKTTTCYMCACRCGIRVHLKDGRIRYIEGNPDHPVNKGVICAKGSAGIMTAIFAGAAASAAAARRASAAPASSSEISWDEALEIATGWLRRCARDRPARSSPSSPAATRSQSLTGFWAAQFGTPNFAAHGGFCSVNMAAGGLYTIGGSLLGIRRAGLGARQVLHDVRRRRGP